jgi:Uma2 family endonuclease
MSHTPSLVSRIDFNAALCSYDNKNMVAIAENLTLAEFQRKYEKGDRSYEYWQGQAVPKGMPTWIHGLLQRIVMELLSEAGYVAGSEVELQIAPDARPKPDVIATKGEVEDPYPTKAVDVVVEVLSPDDSLVYVLDKCRAYHAWGFGEIYVVEPEGRLLFRWTGKALEISDSLTSVPSATIWERLDRCLKRTQA